MILRVVFAPEEMHDLAPSRDRFILGIYPSPNHACMYGMYGEGTEGIRIGMFLPSDLWAVTHVVSKQLSISEVL